jgi:(p)ppGpp synthase/HD superfamily hydrolase
MHSTYEPIVSPDSRAYYEKRLKYLQQALQWLGWYRALDCLDFALQYHKGLRKDNKTPEFLHQVEQALYLLTIRQLLQYPEETICAAILHDTVEDYFEQGVRTENIYALAGELVAVAVERLTNHSGGISKPDEFYYGEMAADVVASIVKPGDWVHNLGSMPGVFSVEKIAGKLEKANHFVFPLIKTARKNFRRQEDAYQNVKTLLIQQVRLLEHFVIANNNSSQQS